MHVRMPYVLIKELTYLLSDITVTDEHFCTWSPYDFMNATSLFQKFVNILQKAVKKWENSGVNVTVNFCLRRMVTS